MEKVIKTYISNTILAFNLRMSGGTKRINFDALSKTGSIYTTDNIDIQTALEQHPYFGKYFKLKASVPVKEKKEEEQKPVKENIVQVSGPEDAKDYLTSQYNISRTQLRTIDAIKKAAASVGVKFEGF